MFIDEWGSRLKVRDFFEWVRNDVMEARQIEQRIEALRLSSGAGRTVTSDAIPSCSTTPRAGNHLIERVAEGDAKLTNIRLKLRPRLKLASALLYGEHGGGGIAKLRGRLDADLVGAYYIDGMTWADVAKELGPPNSKAPKTWARLRARNALIAMEGMDPHQLVRDVC